MLSALLVMLVIGALLGLILSLAAQFLKVEVDERVARVTEMLPGYNCGACGFPGCAGLAEALISSKVDAVSTCKVSKQPEREKLVDYINNSVGPNGEKLVVKI